MPKRMYQVPVAVCIAILCAALAMQPIDHSASQNAAPVTDGRAGWNTYSDAARHFHFQYPEA
jgi:hypothetical protein